METLLGDLTNKESVRNLIINSFEVSSGSTPAQALFIRSLALHLNTNYDAVYESFQEEILKFDDNDRSDFFNNMGNQHLKNSKAKKGVKSFILEKRGDDPDLTNIILNQIPRESKFTRYLTGRKEDFTNKLNVALRNAWQNKSQEITNIELKAIASYLDLFNEMSWWKSLSPDSKGLLVRAGKNLVENGHN